MKGKAMKNDRTEALLPEVERSLEAGAAGLGKQRRSRAVRLGTRGLVVAGALAAVAAAVVIAVGTGGKSGVHPEVASAAELTQIGDSIPRLQLRAEWQIVDTESSPDGGSIQYQYEGQLGEPGTPASGQAEIQWHTLTLAERGEQLEAEGFTFAGAKPMVIVSAEAEVTDDVEHLLNEMSAQVYVANEEADGSFDAAGLWEEGGRTLEYRAHVPDFRTLERLMERIEVLNEEQWLVALQPGGGKWLSESDNGALEKVERVKVGEKPNGDPIYAQTFFEGAPGPESLKEIVESGFPIIVHEGDTVRTVIAKPSTPLSTP
jgi:hypothetical protein